jgi:predicted branched-subunit amino acid permease
MGLAVAPSLRHGPGDGQAYRPARRLGLAALIADASFVIGDRGGGRFDPAALAWSAPVQYVAWVGGTAVGVLGAQLLPDPDRWGADVLFPVFYLSLLLPGLRSAAPADRWWQLVVVVAAAAVALGLSPLAPPGVPVILAAATALLGLLHRGGRR